MGRQRPVPTKQANVVAARRLNRAAGTLDFAVLADSAVEHFRGSFKNRVMVVPLAVATLALASSLHGTADMRPVAHRLRDAGYALAGLTGVVGSGFHLYNVGKKVGGFSWQNFFYGAPVGAPMALVLSGLLGFCGACPRDRCRRDAGLAQSWMRLLVAMGVAGVGFHFHGVSRNMGGFRNWSQNIVAGPPVPAPPSFTGLALAGLAALALMRERSDA